MNATETSARYIDVLPLRSGKRQALEWLPSDVGNAGFVILTSTRDRTAYKVSEQHSNSPLRVFAFVKVSGKGTDKDREFYIVDCTRNGGDAKCNCKGATRWGACRHSDALETLFANHWLT